MDEGNSLERRYNFNLAQGSPVAESTQLIGNSFSWGSSLSPKHNSSCALDLTGTETYSDCKTKNLTKIDARIAVDIQSKGLSSRIVKYHESGTRLNRSMSAHSLYSKIGQFPAVTLQKTELPYRAAKKELSMIRIPPPEKSAFYGNTISSLLRSTSVIGLQCKRSDDLSRENRPIIHPPPTEDDMAPTRSVLDVLKEISRKRINSDNLESEATSKKYCNRIHNFDSFDTANDKMSNCHSNSVVSEITRSKRQRDCVTQHDLQLQDTHTSPEQARKRICSYNNDITSSLSSSIKSKIISAPQSLNHAMPKRRDSSEKEKLKVQLCQNNDNNKSNTRNDIIFENIENNSRKINACDQFPQLSETGHTREANDILEAMSKPTILQPTDNLDQKITKNMTLTEQNSRLTLFNKQCNDSYESGKNASHEVLEKNVADSPNDCAGIPFVKPKKVTTKNSLRNPLIERTQKTKLALMLSGLKGELYANSYVDEFDSANKEEKLPAVKNGDENIKICNVMPEIKLSNTISTLSTAASTSTTVTNFVTKTLVSSTKTFSPLVGLKVPISHSSTENDSSTLNDIVSKSMETKTNPDVPVLGGFSFHMSNSDSADNEASNSTKTAATPISVSISKNNILNFGQTTSSLSLDNKINNLPSKGLPEKNNTSAIIEHHSTINKPFTFGSNITSLNNNSTTVDNSTSLNTSITQDKIVNVSFPTSMSITATSSGPLLSDNFSGSPCLLATKTAAVTSESLIGSTSTPLLVSNTSKETSLNDMKTTPSVPNLTINAITPSGTNSSALMKMQPMNSTLTINSNAISASSSATGQTSEVPANQTRNDTFNFGLPYIKSKPTGISTATFGNISNSLDNAFNISKNTPSINFSSLKTGTQIFGTNSNKNSAAFETKNSTNATNLFTFDSKVNNSPAINTNNVGIAPGGFSFSSGLSNSEKGIFGSTAKTKNLNNSLGTASTSNSENNFKFDPPNNANNPGSIFGITGNKPTENCASPGGFSFGSQNSLKTTFSFGANNISSTNADNGSSNTLTGSIFSVPAGKANESTNSKPFSFASSQTGQQKPISAVPNSNISSSTMFKLSDVTKPTQSAAFNFNSGDPKNLHSNATNVNNMFLSSSPSIASCTAERPIRRATRRLHK